MSIDQLVMAAIEEYNGAWDLSEDGTVHQLLPIGEWNPIHIGEHEAPIVRRIHETIRQAPIAECLSSPYEYIREYKKWCSKE